jgi:hypothetical protein
MDLKNIISNPCETCQDKQEDIYGYYCDISCGRHSQYLSETHGAELLLKALKEQGIPNDVFQAYLQGSNLSGLIHDKQPYTYCGRKGTLVFIPEGLTNK